MTEKRHPRLAMLARPNFRVNHENSACGIGFKPCAIRKADGCGPVGVVPFNLGQEAYAAKRGNRNTQPILLPVARAVSIEHIELTGGERGSGGFGSMGIR